ncbi:MAG: DUF1538 domain-containing protein [Oscillospiraceae bacterium]|nr:DUF1538 domain-containing protein [Oscillospiraceae bacterium]
MNVLLNKLKEVLSAVFPIVILVLILSFTIAPVPGILLARFIIGAILIILGLTLLLIGVDLAFLPLGSNMGKTLLTSNKLWFIIVVGFIIGFFITFAEPSVQVLAEQVSSVTGNLISAGLIRSIISVGAGVLLSVGFTRIVKDFSMRVMMCVILGVILIFSFFAPPTMLAVAFDAAGAATGAVTVPFILALALGAAAMQKDSKTAEQDSFGLVGTAALGSVFGVFILNFFVKTGDVDAVLDMQITDESSLLSPFFAELSHVALNSFLTLLPIFIIFMIFQKFKFHLQKNALRKIIVGFFYAYLGLLLFFVGVNAGFMNAGNVIGYGVALRESKALIVGVGFVLGALIVLTEPAVYVFTHQIEDVTNGHIKRKTVLIFLAVGVAFSVGLSMLRIIVPSIMLWHYLLPGFAAAVVLMFITPKLFVGIGFDSGAVAAGPMTATFVLAFTQGASEAVEYSNVLIDSFGVIAMVTMMPIIALQLLGFIYKLKLKSSASAHIPESQNPIKNGE